MKYALLIYTDATAERNASENELRQMYAQYAAFSNELRSAGKMGPAEELAAPDQAKSVRLRDGRPVVTDGPFAELKEQLGGFYVIDAEDMDEAVRWATKIPSAGYGTIEVRPLASGAYPEEG